MHVVDAFAQKTFEGNPAGVVLLELGDALSDATMGAVAAEMRHAETAFLTPTAKPSEFGLRWFTPTVEVNLCGHATLASAHVLWETGAVPPECEIVFDTLSGRLQATKTCDGICLRFPAEPVVQLAPPFEPSFYNVTSFVGANRLDWLFVLENEQSVRDFTPDFLEIERLGRRGTIVTAPCDSFDCDFVCRFFAPQAGVPEDPVTGSAFCALGPYWSSVFDKRDLTGRQVSQRGGIVRTIIEPEHVWLIGQAVTTLEGSFLLPSVD